MVSSVKFRVGDLFVVNYADPSKQYPMRHGILTRIYTEFDGIEPAIEWLEIYWTEHDGNRYRGDHDAHYVRRTLRDKRFNWKHYPVKEDGNGK